VYRSYKHIKREQFSCPEERHVLLKEGTAYGWTNNDRHAHMSFNTRLSMVGSLAGLPSVTKTIGNTRWSQQMRRSPLFAVTIRNIKQAHFVSLWRFCSCCLCLVFCFLMMPENTETTPAILACLRFRCQSWP
jgi:hypothetical protein